MGINWNLGEKESVQSIGRSPSNKQAGISKEETQYVVRRLIEVVTYIMIRKTWRKKEGVQDLIVPNVQVAIAYRFVAYLEIAMINSKNSPEMEDWGKYAGEVQQELLYLYNGLHIPESKWCHERAKLEYSIAKLVEPL